MGRLGVTRAHLLLLVGAVLIVTGIWLLTCSPGWTVLASGVLISACALFLVDVPSPPAGGR